MPVIQILPPSALIWSCRGPTGSVNLSFARPVSRVRTWLAEPIQGCLLGFEATYGPLMIASTRASTGA